MANTLFLSGLFEVQGRTRQHSETGPTREDTPGFRETVLLLLNDILASEVIWLLRYRRRYLLRNALAAGAGFPQAEESCAADRLARRIVALGGEPAFDLDDLLSRSRADYASSGSVEDRVREDLRAERMVITSYVEAIGYLGASDPLTREVLESNLGREKLRASQLVQLLRECREQTTEDPDARH